MESSAGSRRTRLFPRAKVDLRVTVTRGAHATGPRSTGRARDLGEGGIGLLLAAELHIDEDVWLDFAVAEVHVRVQARVRYRSGVHYGLQFMTLSSRQREAIRAVCAAGEIAGSADGAG